MPATGLTQMLASETQRNLTIPTGIKLVAFVAQWSVLAFFGTGVHSDIVVVPDSIGDRTESDILKAAHEPDVPEMQCSVADEAKHIMVPWNRGSTTVHRLGQVFPFKATYLEAIIVGVLAQRF